jgi:hypothetical protein
MVYSDPTSPFRSVVFYDGGYTMDQATQQMSQRIKGFYQSASTKSAKLTHIVGDGQANFPERMSFNGVSYGPQFTGALGPADDPAWDSPTVDVSVPMATPTPPVPANTGANAMTIVDKGDSSSFDCLSWGAIVFSTTVQDTDSDGLLDLWENTSGLVDPNGTALPNLPADYAAADGATPVDHTNRKDLFLEIGAMRAAAGTTYGPDTDTAGHDHQPSLGVIQQVGNAFKVAGIDLHVDAGNRLGASPYVIPFKHADGTACAAPDPLHPEAPAINDLACLARGGESILETKCVDNPIGTCRFPDYAGVVGWKVGFAYYKDSPVDGWGGQLTPTQEQACETAGTCRTRFDAIRKDIFHYVLFAHSQGARRSADPASPDYKVPTKSSGIGDYPGGDYMVTLGGWGYGFRGPEFVQASTLMHEVGHNLWRGHSGDPFTPFEKNCNPNYLSVMNYMYQIQGLTKDGVPTVDYAGSPLPANLNETSLPSNLGTFSYFPAWYASLATVQQVLGTTAAKKHCDGTPLSAAEEGARLGGGGMVRIVGVNLGTTPIDWNGDLNNLNDAGQSLDVSFNGTVNGSTTATRLRPSDDWSAMPLGLRQLGSRRNIFGLSLDVGRTDSGRTDSGRTDSGRTDSGRTDSGRTDSGRTDSGSDEQDFETATSIRYPPTRAAVTYSAATRAATVVWQEPTLKPSANPITFQVYRVVGGTLTDVNFAKRVFVGQTTSLSIVDSKVKAGETYTYFVIAKHDDQSASGQSNLAVITIPK